MPVAVLFLLILLAGRDPAVSPLESQSAAPCADWRECRRQALSAAEEGDYRRFHDLAWRAVQTGPARDPELMYLLARAQALSGRPHDALVMLQRLADAGVRSDAATNDDFSRTRALPGWPDLAERLDRLPSPDTAAVAGPPGKAAGPPTPKPSVAPAPAARAAAPPPTASAESATASATPAPTGSSPTGRTPPGNEKLATALAATSSALPAVRFTAGGFAVGGLAYDAVSQRFLLGDRFGRKLIVVGEGADHASDLVRASSAGFHDISAVEIDAKRGDLWVGSAAPDQGAGTLHKLQLVSGRVLRSFENADDVGPVSPTDLAVTPNGAILVLDAAARQLLILRVGGTSLEKVLRIDTPDLTSVTATDDDGVAYVSHRDGLIRIDLRARSGRPVATSGTASLSHVERIRWHRRALIAVIGADAGARRIVRLELTRNGRTVAQERTIESSLPAAGRAFATISGDQLVYMVDAAEAPGGTPERTEFVAYRIDLH